MALSVGRSGTRSRSEERRRRSETDGVFGPLRGVFLGTVLGVTVVVLVARRQRVPPHASGCASEGRSQRAQGEETLSQITPQVPQRHQLPLALASKPVARPKRGWRRLWPW
jgi:hypothetical protein